MFKHHLSVTRLTSVSPIWKQFLVNRRKAFTRFVFDVVHRAFIKIPFEFFKAPRLFTKDSSTLKFNQLNAKKVCVPQSWLPNWIVGKIRNFKPCALWVLLFSVQCPSRSNNKWHKLFKRIRYFCISLLTKYFFIWTCIHGLKKIIKWNNNTFAVEIHGKSENNNKRNHIFPHASLTESLFSHAVWLIEKKLASEC